MSDDLAAFLTARLDEDEAAFWAVHDVSKCDALLYADLPSAAPLPDPVNCDCGCPARVLRDVRAKRRHITRYHEAIDGYRADMGVADALEDVLRDDAAVWCDHPDYKETWKP